MHTNFGGVDFSKGPHEAGKKVGCFDGLNRKGSAHSGMAQLPTESDFYIMLTRLTHLLQLSLLHIACPS